MNRAPQPAHAHLDRRGLVLGVTAYALWGILPIYFKLLQALPSVSIVAHRVAWSVPFLLVLMVAVGRLKPLLDALRNKRTLAWLALTASLIGVNWLFYVYAVTSGHILAGSLGYYLNPLANVVLGRLVLKEKLTRLQWTAVAIAAAGTSVLAVGAASQLWISLVLCVSFASYGLLRKIAPVDATIGLAIETLILLPLALGWLGWQAALGAPIFGASTTEFILVVLSGAATAVPLLLFTAAARMLPYSTLGMLQFLAPTLQFLVAVFLYAEPFGLPQAIAFGAIWTALALYVVSMVHSARKLEPAPPE